MENATSETPVAAPASPAAVKKDERRKWYVIHTYSGYENKVKANLERRIHSMNMQDKIFRVLVPMEDEVEFKDGKRKITPKKVFPGYVLVEMDMDDASWYVVRNTSGVTGFVGSPGSGEKPVPLQEKEVKTILKQMGIETPKLKIDFAKGDRVKVTERPVLRFHRHRRRDPAGKGEGPRAHLDLRPRDAGRARVLPDRKSLAPRPRRRPAEEELRNQDDVLVNPAGTLKTASFSPIERTFPRSVSMSKLPPCWPPFMVTSS